MKRLFFNVLAIALGTFAFISCNDDDKVKNEGQDEKYMTVAEQQQAIQASFEGVADAIDFTEFSQALEAVSGLMGMNFETEDLFQIIMSPAVQEDSIFQVKMSEAAMVFTGDSVILDLTPFYMSFDLNIKDTIIEKKTREYDGSGRETVYVDSVLKPNLEICNIRHDVDCFQINVNYNGHTAVLKATTKASENKIVDDNDEEGVHVVVLPESVEISVSLDGKAMASYKGSLKSDMSIYGETRNDKLTMRTEGSKAAVAGSLKVLSYEMAGNFNFDMSKGLDGKFAIKYADRDLMVLNGKVDAVFEGLDLNDTIAALTWAQDPNQLKSVSGSASLGGGQVEVKGSLENPFKDKDLAKYMGTLMTGTILSDDEFEDMVAKFNKLFNVGVYFKGYDKPQAVLKVKYIKAADRKGAEDEFDADEDLSLIDVMGAAIMRAGGYMVFVAHDENGKEVEVSPEEYFGGIDLSKVQSVIAEKALRVFGPYMTQPDYED